MTTILGTKRGGGSTASGSALSATQEEEDTNKRQETEGKNILLLTERSGLYEYDVNDEIQRLIQTCVDTIQDELEVKPEILVFGRKCRQQRCVGFYSNTSRGYEYSHRVMASKPLHPCLQQLLDFMNSKFNYNYNGILINKYIGGEDYISAHSDDESGLDSLVGVVAISYGAVRTFRIRNKHNGKIVINVPTNSAKILQMAGDFQKEFTHEIPVEKKITGTRFSFTFRRHLT